MGKVLIISGADFSANKVAKAPYIYSGNWFNGTIGDGTGRIAAESSDGIVCVGIPMSSIGISTNTITLRVEGYSALITGLKVAICGASTQVSQAGNAQWDAKLPLSGYTMLDENGEVTFDVTTIGQSNYLYVGFVETQSKESSTKTGNGMTSSWMTTNSCQLVIE